MWRGATAMALVVFAACDKGGSTTVHTTEVADDTTCLLGPCDPPDSGGTQTGLRLRVLEEGPGGDSVEEFGAMQNNPRIEVVTVRTIYSRGGYLRAIEVWYRQR